MDRKMIRRRAMALAGAATGLLLLASAALATARRADILMVNGERFSLQANPPEPLLESKPELRPESDIVSTGLWRG